MIGFAKKIGMTRLFVNGKSVAVTVLQVPTQTILQRKTVASDGYNSIQIGAYPRHKGTQAKKGHIKKYSGIDRDFKQIAEFKDCEIAEDISSLSIHDIKESELYNISGKTIGKGFTGAVKRHGFAGQPASHGHDHKRAVGSIGARWPQRTLPGTRMAGHSGAQTRTIRNVAILGVDTEKNLVFVNGSIPGANSSIVRLNKVA